MEDVLDVAMERSSGGVDPEGQALRPCASSQVQEQHLHRFEHPKRRVSWLAGFVSLPSQGRSANLKGNNML